MAKADTEVHATATSEAMQYLADHAGYTRAHDPMNDGTVLVHEDEREVRWNRMRASRNALSRSDFAVGGLGTVRHGPETVSKSTGSLIVRPWVATR